ncbi:OmpA family protein [Roseovarius autotrophicus]|uniref:OmpA family protein n=1 Tax=Roseovarius autotrophicus TaxID=2824121 RepID=UPI0019DC79F4|nr:OmpA family protein [Roseovarius autotrophicus]MBE0453815.1 OmpA family protein [Roseovarius sp.]
MKHYLAITGLVTAMACTAPDDDVYRSYFGEAGSLVDGGSFGHASMQNHLAMTGQADHVIDLANRFASEVPSTVNFAFDSAALDEEARNALREQARWIKQFPEVRFRVYGHTDAVGPDAYNKALGMRRAQAVVGFLVSQGISRSRLEAVASFGATQPLVVTQGRERRNRRTVTEVTGFVQSHPDIMDGKYAAVVYREFVNSARPATTVRLTGAVTELDN